MSTNPKYQQRIPREKSAAMFAEAQNYFPGGVNSPVRAFKSVSGPPLFIDHGKGSRMTDVDGNEFIDFCCSWGPLIHGHANEYIEQKVMATVRRGTSFGTPNEMSNRLGQLILDNHPYVESLRFVSSGTEAVMSALRLARGYTGRNKILKFDGCYHGHVDSLLVKAGSGLATFGTSSSAGVPENVAADTIILPLNDRDLLEQTLSKYADEIACIIVEPIPANNGLLIQDPSWLQCLRIKAWKHNVLLIFDEVISGFRVGFTGAAGLYDVKPDIITFGKVIGGGFPVGAYAGAKKIMDSVAPVGPVYQAGTLSGNPVAMAAGLAALELCLTPGFYELQAQKTSAFADALTAYAREKGYPMHVPHIGSIFWLAFGNERITRSDQIDPANMEYFKMIHHELLQTGVYLGPSGYEVGFISGAHSVADLEEALTKIKAAMDVAFG